MKGILALQAATLTAALILTGCKQDIDYRQVENINGLIYKIKTNEPFNGAITNQPTTTFAALPGSCVVPISNGLLDGNITCKDSENRKILDFSMKEGKKDGTETYYLVETGISYKEINWKNGMRDGSVSLRDTDNGRLVVQQHYVQDRLAGEEKVWDKKGDLVADLIWRNGEKFSGYDKRNAREENYEDGQLNGRQVRYGWNNNKNAYYVSSEEFYNHGVKVGRWSQHDEKGRETKVSNFENGVLTSENETRWENDRISYRVKTVQTNPNATAENYHKTLKREEQVSAFSNQNRTLAFSELMSDVLDFDQSCVDKKVKSVQDSDGEDALVTSDMLSEFENECRKKG